MANKIKVMSVPGTRPDAIKFAPLIKALDNDPEVESVVCVTAQHREMLDQVLNTFNIKPDFDLDIMKSKQSLNDIMAAVVKGMKSILESVQPDIVLVHGDTATSFAAALAAFYEKIDVGHVEAGLRSFDKYSPFPEEMNRRLTSQIAKLHFAPTELNRDNLLKENIKADDIYVTGNTVIDAMLSVIEEDYRFSDDEINRVIGGDKKLVLLTSHRRENQGNAMVDLFNALKDLVIKHEDIQLVYPIHLNPVVRELAFPILGDHPRISLIEPLDYKNFANLMAKSHIIFTDSGGIQEEAPALDVPVVVLRRETERPEGLEAGTLVLAGTDRGRIVEIGDRLLKDSVYYDSIAKAVNPYGDGKSGLRIVEIIKNCYHEHM